jgi:site-specific recombinase XerD
LSEHYLPAVLKTQLKIPIRDRWIDKRKELGLGRRSRLFCTLEGKPIDTSYVRHLMKRLAAKAGIDKRVHAHGLRHTLAAELAAEHVPMNMIQAQLGHGSLATTSRYLDHIRPQQLIDEMQQREPWDPEAEDFGAADNPDWSGCGSR